MHTDPGMSLAAPPGPQFSILHPTTRAVYAAYVSPSSFIVNVDLAVHLMLLMFLLVETENLCWSRSS